MNSWIAQKHRARAEWIRRTEPLLPEPQSREWWLAEAKRMKTDWSALLRQRLRVLAWVRAGRPPWAEWSNRRIFEVWPRGLDFEDKIDAPVPELIEHIYRSTEKWKRSQQYAKRKVTQRTVLAAVQERPQQALVPGTLMTEEDAEDFR